MLHTFQLGDMWIAKQDNFVAFGTYEHQVVTAVKNPQDSSNDDLIVNFSKEEWEILSYFVLHLNADEIQKAFTSNVTFEGEEAPRVGEAVSGEAVSGDRMVTPAILDPRNATYAVLSPVGRKYGTWAIMRQSTRTETNWEIVMPDVGSAETARRLVAMLNAQGADVGSKLVARGL